MDGQQLNGLNKIKRNNTNFYNMKKQTATEWLFEKLLETPKDKLTWNAILEQAKEIHKQQAIEDMNRMQIVRHINYINEVKFSFNPEQYYKETYGE